jgi:hypothetical protein
MKNYPLGRVGAIAVAIVGGTCLGYFQDNITTSLLSYSFLSVLLIGGMVGWLVCTVWYGAALRISWLRRIGIKPTLQGFIFILLYWVFTVIGSVVFLSLYGTVSMPLFLVVVLSIGMAMAYNFFLVVLPLFIFWGVRSALSKHE